MIMRFHEAVKNVLKYTPKAWCLLLLVVTSNLQSASYIGPVAVGLSNVFYYGCSLVPAALFLTRQKIFGDIEKEHASERGAESGYPLAMAYAKVELEALGLKQVRVIPYGFSCVFVYHIAIEWGYLEAADASLERIERARGINAKPDPLDLLLVREFKAILHHEAGHLLNRDVSRRFPVAALSSACIVLAAGRALSACLGSDQWGAVRACVSNILGGVLNGAIATQLFFAASRQMEYQADAVTQDSDAIKGMICFFQKYLDRLRMVPNDSPCMLWLYEHMLTHPSPISRIERLKQRLQEITA